MEADIGPVLCELQYSGRVAALLASAATCTVGVAVMLPGSLALRGFVALAVVALALREHRTLREVRALLIAGNGDVRVTRRDGGSREGRLESGSFVAPWLTLVRWRPAGARFDRTILVAPGMADPQAFRRLRVRLRHG